MNVIGWGTAVVTNLIGWGQSANNAISWGIFKKTSHSGETIIYGVDSVNFNVRVLADGGTVERIECTTINY